MPKATGVRGSVPGTSVSSLPLRGITVRRLEERGQAGLGLPQHLGTFPAVLRPLAGPAQTRVKCCTVDRTSCVFNSD